MPDIMSTLGLIAVMGLLFYLLLIRPQQRRAKEQTKMMDALQPGATVMLSSGIIANVVEIGETQVLVEIAPGLEMSVLKQVIINTTATDEFAADDPALEPGASAELESADLPGELAGEPTIGEPTADEAFADPDAVREADAGEPDAPRPDRSQE